MTYYRTNAGAAALAFARQLTGKPYVWGGTWPVSGGTDCSGLVQWAYEQVGILLGRTTYVQYTEYPLGHAQPSLPGDLLFIAGSDPGAGGEPGHVMMYVSPGMVFQAPATGELIGQYAYDTTVFEYRTRPALLLPLPPKKTPDPSQAVLDAHGYVWLQSHADAALAQANGWTIYIWNGYGFTDAPAHLPLRTKEYASSQFATPNPTKGK